MAGRKKIDPKKLKKYRITPRLLSDEDLEGFESHDEGIGHFSNIANEAIETELSTRKKGGKAWKRY